MNMRCRAPIALAAFAALVAQWPAPSAAQAAALAEDAASAPRPVSEAVTVVATWVLASRDDGDLPYIVFD